MEEMKKKLAEYEQEKELFAAIDLLEQLIEAEPEDASHMRRLASMLIDTGQVERAEQILRQHLQDEPENRWLQLNLGHALKALGKPEEAVENYLEVAKGEDAVSAIGFWSLANMRVFKFDDLFLTLLRDQVQQSEVGSPARGLMLFALAAAWEQRENHEAAFMAMSEANLIFAAQRPFRGDLFGQMVKSMCDEVQVASKLPAQDGPTPIFVLGMPRSGTTLVEQILAAHSDVEATDELPFLNRIGLDLEKSGGYAKALSSMDAELQQQLASEYLSKVERYRKDGKGFFIDKMPSNFLHIGLIKALFPNARIINVIRDPLDNAIGVFKMYFQAGAEYSFSMEGIIYHWQGYITLMKHWDELYPGEIMHLSYEELASDPDTKIGDILSYCGLDVEESCFRFYESDRPVLTPSAGQVRSPISTRSIGSGQKYEKYLKTSIPALAEIKRVSREVFGIS
jgi:tetratricopeptide (TPR) repeat protein